MCGYTACMDFISHYVSSVESTNTTLKELAKQGLPEGYVLVADSQTGGRGRLGRSFFSPIGGLYASILLRPSFLLPPASFTCLTAVAAADTIASFGGTCSIKWVNDIYCGNRKAGGILVEGAVLPSGCYDYVIVGIGLNLSVTDDVPSELSNVMASIFDRTADISFRDSFLERFLEHFRRYYEPLPEITFREKYDRLQNCYGRMVSFSQNGKTFVGKAESIDEEFRLNVRTGSGLVPLERGEVTFL